jgi:hypothetical protein
VVDLGRADAQIEEDGGYGFLSNVSDHRLEPVESGSTKDNPVLEARERDGCCSQGFLVPVQTKEPVSGKSVEQSPGVPAAANGGVDDQPERHGPEELDDFVEHDRPVLEPLAHPQPPDQTETVGMSPRSM